MNFLEESILRLSNQRRVFHSEHDLKFSLAFIIKENNPNFEIRIERPVQIDMILKNGEAIVEKKRSPVDIVVVDKKDNAIFPIEIKYKTRKLITNYIGEDYELTNHAAPDQGRYSFRKDIYRVEQYPEKDMIKVGYVFILTNDYNYFTDISKEKRFDSNYSFHNGHILPKEDNGWIFENLSTIEDYKYDNANKVLRYKKDNNIHWSYKGEYAYKLNLSKDYKVQWHPYSRIDKSEFKYCLIKI